jgi:predicted nucleic acid-binding protein
LRRGHEPTSARRGHPSCRQASQGLTTAIEGLLDEDFRDRILPFDRAPARAYATIAAARRAAGRPISQFDCQIAAIAGAHEATVATRNTSDYQGCGIDLINPWTFSARQ